MGFVLLSVVFAASVTVTCVFLCFVILACVCLTEFMFLGTVTHPRTTSN